MVKGRGFKCQVVLTCDCTTELDNLTAGPLNWAGDHIRESTGENHRSRDRGKFDQQPVDAFAEVNRFIVVAGGVCSNQHLGFGLSEPVKNPLNPEIWRATGPDGAE